MRAFET